MRSNRYALASALWRAKMLEFITSLVVAILVWIEKRFDKGSTATDGKENPDALSRAGKRVSDGLRPKDGSRS